MVLVLSVVCFVCLFFWFWQVFGWLQCFCFHNTELLFVFVPLLPKMVIFPWCFSLVFINKLYSFTVRFWNSPGPVIWLTQISQIHKCRRVSCLIFIPSQYHFIFNPPSSDKSASGRVSRQNMMRALSLHHMFYCLWRYASCLSLALKDTFMNLLQCLLLLLLLPLWQRRNKKDSSSKAGCVGPPPCPNPKDSSSI